MPDSRHQVNAKNGPVADNALWAGLQAAVKAGLTKSIGVSNYHTEDLLALAQAVRASQSTARIAPPWRSFPLSP